MTRTGARRKSRARGLRLNGNGAADKRALELLQTIHGFGSLGFLLAIASPPDNRVRRSR